MSEQPMIEPEETPEFYRAVNEIGRDARTAAFTLAALRAQVDTLTRERDEARAEAELARSAYKQFQGYMEWKALRQQNTALTRENAALREAAFRAGYHCRWHREQGVYCFDPAMSPGDPDGAYAAWLEAAALASRTGVCKRCGGTGRVKDEDDGPVPAWGRTSPCPDCATVHPAEGE